MLVVQELLSCELPASAEVATTTGVSTEGVVAATGVGGRLVGRCRVRDVALVGRGGVRLVVDTTILVAAGLIGCVPAVLVATFRGLVALTVGVAVLVGLLLFAVLAGVTDLVGHFRGDEAGHEHAHATRAAAEASARKRGAHCHFGDVVVDDAVDQHDLTEQRGSVGRARASAVAQAAAHQLADHRRAEEVRGAHEASHETIEHQHLSERVDRTEGAVAATPVERTTAAVAEDRRRSTAVAPGCRAGLRVEQTQRPAVAVDGLSLSVASAQTLLPRTATPAAESLLGYAVPDSEHVLPPNLGGQMSWL